MIDRDYLNVLRAHKAVRSNGFKRYERKSNGISQGVGATEFQFLTQWLRSWIELLICLWAWWHTKGKPSTTYFWYLLK